MIECRSVLKVPGLVVGDLPRAEQIQTVADLVADEIQLEQFEREAARKSGNYGDCNYDLGAPQTGPDGSDWVSCSVEQMALFIAERLIDLGTSDFGACDAIITDMIGDMLEPASEAVN